MGREEPQKKNPRWAKAGDLKEGEWMNVVRYVKFTGKRNLGDQVELMDDEGRTLFSSESLIEREYVSASQFDKEEKVTRTEMVQILMDAGDTVFTVKFHKQLTPAVAMEKLTAEDYAGQTTDAKRKKVLKNLLEGGEDRTLVGHLLQAEPTMGRSQVIDLELEPGKFNQRQVDHRTIYELIINRVKYVLK